MKYNKCRVKKTNKQQNEVQIFTYGHNGKFLTKAENCQLRGKFNVAFTVTSTRMAQIHIIECNLCITVPGLSF